MKRIEHRGSGRAKWYRITDDIEVCGLYEASFCKWLIECGFTFTAHPAPLPWYDENGEHYYHPDFWIEELQTYVDVKAKRWAELHAEKIAKIQAQHDNIQILTEDDFAYLKIEMLQLKPQTTVVSEPKGEPYKGRIGISVGCKPPTRKKAK